MNDMISRRAAIDAVHEEFDECTVWDESGEYTADVVERILDDVPAAQPTEASCWGCNCPKMERLKEQPIILFPKESAQPGEDIRAMCGECDAWNQYKNYPQPGWIPCSRELPKKDGQYNVTVKYEHVDGYEDIYSEHGEWVDGHWDAGYGHCGRVEKVLAWMPLPKPYADEKDGDGV